MPSFPRTPFLACGSPPSLRSGQVCLDEREHFLHNRGASVAALRELFAFGPECRSRSLRNQCSSSPESSTEAGNHLDAMSLAREVLPNDGAGNGSLCSIIGSYSAAQNRNASQSGPARRTWPHQRDPPRTINPTPLSSGNPLATRQDLSPSYPASTACTRVCTRRGPIQDEEFRYLLPLRVFRRNHSPPIPLQERDLAFERLSLL